MFKLVFVCSTNGARSQMAEGLAKSILGDLVTVKSAGRNPRAQLNRTLIEVMNEAKIDISAQYVKSLEEIDFGKANLTIHLSSQEKISASRHAHKQLYWCYTDPLKISTSPERKEALRNMRDDLSVRISLLKNQILSLDKTGDHSQ
jgi:protein-tyrosine-phosphatase